MWWIFAVVIVLVALAVLAMRHPRFKSWRAGQLAEKSIAALESGDAEAARNDAIAAYQLSPRNPAVLRAAGRVAAEMHDPQALAFYKALVDLGAADGEDYLGFASAALDGQFRDVFESSIHAAIARLPADDLRIERLLGRYALMNGDYEAAARAFHHIVDEKPASSEAKLDLASALLANPQMSAQRTAPPILEEAMKQDSSSTNRALMMLGGAAGLPRETRMEALKRLIDSKNTTLADKLDAWRLMIAISPDARETAIESATKLCSTNGEDHRADFARWLIRIGANDKAQQILPLQVAIERMDLFLVWLDAASGQGRWNDVETALDRPNVPLPPSVRDLFYGRALAEQGKTSSNLYYEKAVAGAEGDVPRLFYLAGYFNELGETRLAERSLDLLTRDPLAARTAYEALIGIDRRNRDTQALANTLDRMQKRWPNDPAVANDIRYIQLLRRRDIAIATEGARVAAAENPGIVPFQITLALALLSEGRAAEAISLFEGSNLQLAQLLPQQKVIFAAALAANGDLPAARDVGSLVDRSQLLPEELDLLEKAEDR